MTPIPRRSFLKRAAGFGAALGGVRLTARIATASGSPPSGQGLQLVGSRPDPSEAIASQEAVLVRGEVVDAATGRALPSRVYIQRDDGSWFFPESTSPEGSAVEYRKQRPAQPDSVEMHTTLSAHPWRVSLPPGRYTLVAERGKEYHAAAREFTVPPASDDEAGEPFELRIELERWIDMPARGWYSGETHVHRTLEELPNVMLAEDLNVAFPLLYWVTEAFTPPAAGDRSADDVPAEPITVDPTHVICPRNTEYEIFTVGGRRHTLGAFFALNHGDVLDRGVPPVKPIAEIVHRRGGLIELDKHAWPWSMMLVPVMQADLYELANNHVWRTEFGFTAWGEPAADYMRIERDADGWTERGWIDYGLENYYALLNCGFRMRPTAGTASGVHPVPLGFGRVYVHLPEGFSHEAWLRGLDAGRSFVTTGPMLFAEVNGSDPGHAFEPDGGGMFRVRGSTRSAEPLKPIEIVASGRVVRTIEPANREVEGRAYENIFDERIQLDGSGWFAVRCFEDRADGRVRFAHTAPWYVDVPGRPLRPRREEVAFLISRVEEQIAASADVLPVEALAEYREALHAYEEIARQRAIAAR